MSSPASRAAAVAGQGERLFSRYNLVHVLDRFIPGLGWSAVFGGQSCLDISTGWRELREPNATVFELFDGSRSKYRSVCGTDIIAGAGKMELS
jgi:hypothetical protein